MKTSPQLYFITMGIICLVTLFTVFLPARRQQETVAQQILKEKAKLTDFKTTLENLPYYLNSSDNLRTTKQNLSDKLYTRSEVMSLLRHLYLDAEEHNLNIKEVTPPVNELLQLNCAVTDSLQPLFLNIYLKMDGKYTDFGQFVQEVEQDDCFRGTNICKIIGSKEETQILNFQFGFKVLLGLMEAQG